MKVLLLLLALAGGAYYFFGREKPDVELLADGAQQTLVLRKQDVKAEYAVGEPYEETFMLFGANAEQDLAHAWFAGVTTRYAAFLLRQYPTITKCGTPGTKEAMAVSKTFEVIGADRALREQLLAAVNLFEERNRNNGDRVCLRVGGSRLALRASEKGGFALTVQKPADWFVVVGNSVETMDCAPIVSRG